MNELNHSRLTLRRSVGAREEVCKVGDLMSFFLGKIDEMLSAIGVLDM